MAQTKFDGVKVSIAKDGTVTVRGEDNEAVRIGPVVSEGNSSRPKWMARPVGKDGKLGVPSRVPRGGGAHPARECSAHVRR
jgi:hypothetical protein